MRRTLPLIIGGGPAGAAAALTLARHGVRAELLERTTAPHDPVCGGFLGWDAIAALERLGVDPWSLGAQPITHVRIISGEASAEAALPARAAGLSRRRLDTALLERAAGRDVTVTRGAIVRRVEDGIIHLADGAALKATSLFLATGKHDVRGLQRDSARPARIGLRTSIPAPHGLAGWIELHLLDGGYAGLLVQEDGTANLCLSIASARLVAAGGLPEQLLGSLADEAPMLMDRIRGVPGDWSAVAAVPYGWRARDTRPGCFRIGDQAAVIASLAGDGIAIALASGRAAAKAWLGGGGAASAPAFQRAFARRAFRPIMVAEQLRHTAERPGLARPLTRLLGMMPGSLGLTARLTRIGP